MPRPHAGFARSSARRRAAKQLQAQPLFDAPKIPMRAVLSSSPPCLQFKAVQHPANKALQSGSAALCCSCSPDARRRAEQHQEIDCGWKSSWLF